MAAYIPSTRERIWNDPSVKFYKGLCDLFKTQYGDDLWQPLPNPQWHNHYLIVMRECKEGHNEVGDCTQFLYPLCSHPCLLHTYPPISRIKLNAFLENFLGA